MALPTKTRAARLHGPQDLRIDELDVPPMGPDDVMVAVEAVGVCGSDMHYVDAGRNGQNVLRQPTVLGHEASGVVVAAGAASGIRVGMRVAVEPAIGCGVCPTCRSGHYNVCPVGTCLGSPPTNGTMSELIVVPARSLHELPAHLDTVVGAMIEPLSVAVWAVRRAQIHAGHRVLITGAGPIGVLVAQVARASGATEIIMTDVNDDRLAMAGTFGATRVVNTARDELGVAGVDRVVECTGVPSVLSTVITTVRPGGRVTVVGQAAPSVDGLPLAFLQRYEVDLVAAFRYAHAFPSAIALVASGAVDIERVMTGRFSLDETAEAIRAPGNDPTHLKVVVMPGAAARPGA